ncbi:MAG: histidinol-phosphate transaminase [Rickettsiales bacterium]|nr:histidinol-phosphate transaminase [Rickettsiales bacterium]
MTAIKHNDFLDVISPYVGGKTHARAGAKIIKLSSNENPLGPSPQALEAFQAAAAKLHRYPQDGAASLRATIEEQVGLAQDQLIVGAGSDEIIGMIVRAFATIGDEVLFPEHAFLMYRIYTQQQGATPVSAPETNLTTDVDALLAAVTPNTKIVFFANPNNPTGTYISAQEVTRLRDELRDDILLVIDGAYAEYMRDVKDYTDGRELIERGNVIITKTFSKLHGLPALRVGYGYGPKALIDVMYKVRAPFNVTQPALAAAEASLRDSEYLNAEIDRNARERESLTKDVRAMGLGVTPSFANFILIHFPSEDGARASDANAYLLEQGIIPREVANYGLPDCLRVSIGSADDNEAFKTALHEFLNR